MWWVLVVVDDGCGWCWLRWMMVVVDDGCGG